MLRRATVTAVVLIGMTGATGCSWLFQDRLRGGYEGYTGRSEPRCTTSKGWAAVDGVLGGLHVLSVLLVATSEEPIENRSTVIVGNVLWTLVHTASAITGASWASDCGSAYDEWNAIDSGSTAGEAQERRRLALELAGNHQNDPRKARAFWCAASSGDCVVDQAACTEGGCSRQETAWCSGGKGGFVCNKTRAGCLAVRYSRRSRNMGECVERRAELGTSRTRRRAPPLRRRARSHRRLRCRPRRAASTARARPRGRSPGSARARKRTASARATLRWPR
jgi:hypothetical protein